MTGYYACLFVSVHGGNSSKNINSGEDQGVIRGDNESSVLAYLHLHVALRSARSVVAVEVIIYPEVRGFGRKCEL